MSSPSDYSSSILGSGSLDSESPPQQILQSSSFVSFTETPSMVSLPSRQNAGEDASAISNAADYNENNNDSGSHKSQRHSSSKNKNGRIPTFFLIVSASTQFIFFVTLLHTAITEWTSFEETLKYGYGISTFLQFEFMIVSLLSLCIGNGCASFFACFNVAVLAIIENIMVLYVLSTDWNVENCDLGGCTFLRDPYQKRKEFLYIHGMLGLYHFIMALFFCCIRSYSSSRRNGTSSDTSSTSGSSENYNVSQAPPKREAPPHRHPRSQPSSIKSSRASHSQSSRPSSYRSTTIKYNVRVKPTSPQSRQRQHTTTLNIPQKHDFSSSYPLAQHSSTVCRSSLPPPIPCGYHQSFIQQQHFPLQNITNNYVDGGRTMIVDVPETEQPYGYVDIQRVVIKLPALMPSESALVSPAYRHSSKQ